MGWGSVFKRNRRGATVGFEMDGPDGPGRLGLVVVADHPPPDSSAASAWAAGFASKSADACENMVDGREF